MQPFPLQKNKQLSLSFYPITMVLFSYGEKLKSCLHTFLHRFTRRAELLVSRLNYTFIPKGQSTQDHSEILDIIFCLKTQGEREKYEMRYYLATTFLTRYENSTWPPHFARKGIESIVSLVPCGRTEKMALVQKLNIPGFDSLHRLFSRYIR